MTDIDSDQALTTTLDTVAAWRAEYFEKMWGSVLNNEQAQKVFNVQEKHTYQKIFNEVCVAHVLSFFEQDNPCSIAARQRILQENIIQWQDSYLILTLWRSQSEPKRMMALEDYKSILEQAAKKVIDDSCDMLEVIKNTRNNAIVIEDTTHVQPISTEQLKTKTIGRQP